MQLLTFKSGGENRLGIKTASGVIDVAKAGQALGVAVPGSMAEAIAQGTSSLSTLAGKAGSGTAPAMVEESTLQYAPCVPNPGKIICIGLNYRKHAEESGSAIPTHPVIFSKFSNTLAANGESIALSGVA